MTIDSPNGGQVDVPAYQVKTLEYVGNCTYREGTGDNCPCDLMGNANQDANMNTIIAEVADSVAKQQAAIDEEYYYATLAPGQDYTPMQVAPVDLLNGAGADDVNYAYQFNDGTLWIAGSAVE